MKKPKNKDLRCPLRIAQRAAYREVLFEQAQREGRTVAEIAIENKRKALVEQTRIVEHSRIALEEARSAAAGARPKCHPLPVAGTTPKSKPSAPAPIVSQKTDLAAAAVAKAVELRRRALEAEEEANSKIAEAVKAHQHRVKLEQEAQKAALAAPVLDTSSTLHSASSSSKDGAEPTAPAAAEQPGPTEPAGDSDDESDTSSGHIGNPELQAKRAAELDAEIWAIRAELAALGSCPGPGPIHRP